MPLHEEAQLVGARLTDGPLLTLLAQPLALGFAWLFTLSFFGKLLAMLAQIQFHELGHALPAWLSSRAALPLPFGFTFWREQPSLVTGVCFAFLAGVLIYRGYVEERRGALLIGGSALAGWVTLTWLVSVETSRMLILAGGFVAELVLPALALVAFHLRLPDRLRWDFFRFLVLPIAACAFVGALRLWLGIAHGGATLPMGSFLPGDGAGDFDRLISEHGFSQARIIRIGTTSARLSVLGLGVSYVLLVARALRRTRSTPRPGA
ncbi:MAG TPA: hypothetical protein VFZ61_24685 [Polyangiales bacterium]